MIRFLFLNDSDKRVVGLLDRGGEGILRGIQLALTDEMRKLQNYIKVEKLSGQVLHRRTGNLSGSLFVEVDRDPTGITGVVQAGREAPYARIHEYGFDGTETVREHLRRNPSGTISTVRQHTREMHMPARSYMRTSLEERKYEIIQGLVNGITAEVAKL